MSPDAPTTRAASSRSCVTSPRPASSARSNGPTAVACQCPTSGKGTRPATLRGTIVGPAIDHFGTTRVGLKLETTVDRTQFDIKWNMPLPNGEPALSHDVTLKADLTLVQAA